MMTSKAKVALATLFLALSLRVAQGDEATLDDILKRLGVPPGVGASILGLTPPPTNLEWTEENDMSKFYPPDARIKDDDGEELLGFRDLMLESLATMAFDKMTAWIAGGGGALRDPYTLGRGTTHFRKKSGLFEIDLRANDLRLSGLRKLRVTYLRVVRHYGLRDIKVSLRVGTDLELTGQYLLSGTAMEVLPLSGHGPFSIQMKGVEILGMTFMVLKPPEDLTNATNSTKVVVVARELAIQVSHQDIRFNFENLMGGGAVGSTVNLLINAMGEAVVESQKKQANQLLSGIFRRQLENIF